MLPLPYCLFIFTFLEIPLQSQGGVEEEGLVAGGVNIINEVVRNLPLGTYGQVRGDVVPQLGLSEDNEASVTIGLLATPEVDEACKAQLVVEEVHAPHASELGAGIRMRVVVALQEMLIKHLNRPCL